MGAVIAKQSIHDVFMQSAPENGIEFYHGYTYSGHPLACAAAIATMQVYHDEKLFERAASPTTITSNDFFVTFFQRGPLAASKAILVNSCCV